MVLTQSDKIVVSKLLTLEQFGYYTLAWTVGGALANLVNPVFVAVFPRLSQLVKQEDSQELSRVYHASCQLVAVVVLPAAATLALFSREVLFAWSGDPRVVSTAAPVVTMVAAGMALNGLMNVPYALMLAFGWTRLNIAANLIAVFTIAPLEYVVTARYGLIGAAAGWVALNAGYVCFLIPVMHRRVLRGQKGRWYVVDVALPSLGLAAVLVPLRAAVRFPGGRLGNCLYLAAIGAAGVLAAIAAAPEVRHRALALLSKLPLGRSTWPSGR
jgi:O-antigen/teichoic acid export membrane protein